MFKPYPKPAKRKHRAPAAPTSDTRGGVIVRDQYHCQWCGKHVRIQFGEYSLQHRRARGAGGTVRTDANGAANLVLVCGSATTGCHGEIEAHPAEAARRGFRISQETDPAEIPIRCRMQTEGLTWCLLDDDYQKGFMTMRDAEQVMFEHGIEVA